MPEDFNDPLALPPVTELLLCDPYEVDTRIAVAKARASVAGAYGRWQEQRLWERCVVHLAEQRVVMRRLRDAIDDACMPTVDLGELPDDDVPSSQS